MRPHHRLSVAAFCTDLALYLLMLSLPFRALDLGASSLVLGLVPVLYAAPYAAFASTAGWLSDRWPRRRLIRCGLGLAAVGALSLARAQRLETILFSVPVVGIGLGFVWPSLQAGFSEIQQGRDLNRMVRWLNASWSSGKGSGFLLGGVLLSAFGGAAPSVVAAAALLVAATVLPWMPRGGDHGRALREEDTLPGEDIRTAFRRSAWIANGITFGVAATLNHHLPRLTLSYGMGPSAFGLFLGLVFLSQTALFVLVGHHRWWRYRGVPLLVLQGLVALLVLLIPSVRQLGWLLATAPLVGLCLGFAYQSSLSYSLHAPLARGRHAGIHEATLGVCSASIPLAGGALVSRAGLLAPFFVAATAAVLSLCLGARWIRSARS
jgi:MFS family permease